MRLRALLKTFSEAMQTVSLCTKSCQPNYTGIDTKVRSNVSQITERMCRINVRAAIMAV
jgi:hypothetical protein